ncbi:aspartate kinase [Parashewanella spongiae]|uniref:aspartate kinase n=1 Tax=Parashewanella spongiae TaxID=342950 RepID=UPI001FD2BB00|nr:aspartate kinase [Parashewanella spongiae]
MQEKKLSSNRLYIKKFGGTSVCSVERIEVIADKIAASHHKGDKQVIVLSAMAGETNRLFSLGQQIDSNACNRELDVLVSTGEQVNIALMAMALIKRGIKARSMTGVQANIRTCSQFGSAQIESVDATNIQSLLNENIIPIVAGFQGQDSDGNITTLGRGGSDTSAVAIAAALQAQECMIYTDVDGIYHIDPKIVSEAIKFKSVSFSVMHEMAKLGAKVLHPDSVYYAQKYKVPIRVLSSLSDKSEGTLIDTNNTTSTKSEIISIVAQERIAILDGSIENNINNLCNETALNKVCLSDGLIWENPIKGNNCGQYYAAPQVYLEPSLHKIDSNSLCYNLEHFVSESELVCISLIAEPEQKVAENLTRVLDILGKQDIHVKLTATSEKGLSIIVDDEMLYQTVRTLHCEFGFDKL